MARQRAQSKQNTTKDRDKSPKRKVLDNPLPVYDLKYSYAPLCKWTSTSDKCFLTCIAASSSGSKVRLVAMIKPEPTLKVCKE